MATIVPFLRAHEASFDQNDITAMSLALDGVCEELHVGVDANARETIAVRIIELARRGERSPSRLRDRVLAEANGMPVFGVGNDPVAGGGNEKSA